MLGVNSVLNYYTPEYEEGKDVPIWPFYAIWRLLTAYCKLCMQEMPPSIIFTVCMRTCGTVDMATA
jgi:hypothetical protein